MRVNEEAKAVGFEQWSAGPSYHLVTFLELLLNEYDQD